MRKQFIIGLLCCLLGFYSFAVNKISIDQYIEKWSPVAVQQMETFGIPASITLAQGILESGFGNSKLARKANNHFGIKCHGWEGDSFFQDDDKKDECFRKYDDAMESYLDHSKFLTGRSRYAFLFELKVTDYKGWARGLKKAGYATSNTYARKLIDLIERYELYKLDKMSSNQWIAENPVKKDNEDSKKENPKPILEIEIQNKKYEVLTAKNNANYIVAGKHDTFYLIAKNFDLNLRQLYRWNDFPEQKYMLKEGDIVYISRGKIFTPDSFSPTPNSNPPTKGGEWYISKR